MLEVLGSKLVDARCEDIRGDACRHAPQRSLQPAQST
jgi:hypothetical protein